MRVRVGCEFDFVSEAPVPMLMLVRPRPTAEHQIEYESRWTDPELPVREYLDSFGNTCWRFTSPGGPFQIRYDALVGMSDAPDVVAADAPLIGVDHLPDSALVYTLASRYIESDLLVPISWQLFGETPPTWARIQAICDWVHTNVEYTAGSSDPTVTAMDIFKRRVGVCRDFALLAIGLCRAVNIPARYAFGYLPDIGVEPPDVPMDFHAWFEAYVGDRWYAFDARHNAPRIGRVLVGHGRDAVDVAMVTQYGAMQLNTMSVWAEEVLHTPEPEHDADEQEAAELTPRGTGG
ncbi:MAG: transglutaminase family protein [Chloroflexi bacterium]|nr:transglutaminase family protein [Chloroflexota bacterium]